MNKELIKEEAEDLNRKEGEILVDQSNNGGQMTSVLNCNSSTVNPSNVYTTGIVNQDSHLEGIIPDNILSQMHPEANRLYTELVWKNCASMCICLLA